MSARYIAIACVLLLGGCGAHQAHGSLASPTPDPTSDDQLCKAQSWPHDVASLLFDSLGPLPRYSVAP